MKSRKSRTIFFAIFFVVLGTWCILPRIPSFYGHPVFLTGKMVANSPQNVTCGKDKEYDLEEYNRASYFNIFKFVCSFIPSRKHHTEKADRPSAKIPVLGLISGVLGNSR